MLDAEDPQPEAPTDRSWKTLIAKYGEIWEPKTEYNGTPNTYHKPSSIEVQLWLATKLYTVYIYFEIFGMFWITASSGWWMGWFLWGLPHYSFLSLYSASRLQ